MENTSKALLIAAAVLIVILLIAFGMKILSPTQGIEEQAQGVGQSISSATDKATQHLGSVISSKGWKVSADGKTYNSSDGRTVKFRR